MLKSDLAKEIFIAFAGTILALLSAGVAWFIKSAHERYRNETLALAKIERIFLENLLILKDNFEFINTWIEVLKNNRHFSFQFGSFNISEEETYKIKNIELINNVLSVNYKLRRTELDLNNIYKNYWDIIIKIDSIEDEVKKKENLENYNNGVQLTLEQIRRNENSLKTDMIKTVALTRAVYRARSHSLLGYLNFLSRDVFPRVSQKFINKHIEIINKNY